MSEAPYIAVVDDDEAVCDALSVLLAAADHSARTFSTLSDFRTALKIAPPAVLLLDVRLPDGNGLDFLHEVLGYASHLPVIMITGHGDVPLAVAAMKSGARDFLEKPFDPSDLLVAINLALAPPEDASTESNAELEAKQRLASLTQREREVLENLIDGASSKEIARKLEISPRTIEAHRARLMSKTGSRSLSAIVRLALLAGLRSNDVP